MNIANNNADTYVMHTPGASTQDASQESIRRPLCCLGGEQGVPGYWSSVAETSS
jgi:hypothetical protein